MLFDMKRPSPVLVVDFVANFVNSLGNISESMPAPVSLMLTLISLVIVTAATLTLTVPSLVNLIALLRRLEIT